MTVCPLCGKPVGTLEAHRVEVVIYPDAIDDEITVHPDCCPGNCDSPFEHPTPIDI